MKSNSEGVQLDLVGRSKPLHTYLQEALASYSWQSVVWTVNGLFIVITIFYHYVFYAPGSPRGMAVLAALFSLHFEKNVATYWEGWCLLLVALLAMERFFNSPKLDIDARQAWVGLAVLAAVLSLDELGSIHERADSFFSPWSVPGWYGFIPLALPAILVLSFTLQRMWRLPDRRLFWLTSGAFVMFGSVAMQEGLEHAMEWPWWTWGIRVGVEEGVELLGIFLLLSAVLTSTLTPVKFKSVLSLFPQRQTLIQLKSAVVCLTLLSFIPLAIVTVAIVVDRKNMGIPAAWLPFMLLNLSWMLAWACAQTGEAYRKRCLLAAVLALFFAFDQIIIFHRVVDMSMPRGEVERLMFPCLAAVCMSIPILRTRVNALLIAVLLPWSLLVTPAWELVPRLTLPLQALGIYYILVSGLTTAPQWRVAHDGPALTNA